MASRPNRTICHSIMWKVCNGGEPGRHMFAPLGVPLDVPLDIPLDLRSTADIFHVFIGAIANCSQSN